MVQKQIKTAFLSLVNILLTLNFEMHFVFYITYFFKQKMEYK